MTWRPLADMAILYGVGFRLSHSWYKNILSTSSWASHSPRRNQLQTVCHSSLGQLPNPLPKHKIENPPPMANFSLRVKTCASCHYPTTISQKRLPVSLVILSVSSRHILSSLIAFQLVSVKPNLV